MVVDSFICVVRFHPEQRNSFFFFVTVIMAKNCAICRKEITRDQSFQITTNLLEICHSRKFKVGDRICLMHINIEELGRKILQLACINTQNVSTIKV